MKQLSTQLHLTQQEKDLLIRLYHRRMITKAYLDENVPMAVKQALVNKGLIIEETIEDWEQTVHEVYFLTQDGTQVVYELLMLPNNVLNEKDSIIERHRFKLSELKPKKTEKHARRLLEQTRFVESTTQLLGKYSIEHQYYDRLFNELNSKKQEHYIPQTFPSDGVLLVKDCEIHIHSIQERPTKVKLFTEKTYLPFVKSETFAYRERPMLLLFLAQTKEDVEKHRETICQMMGAHLTPYFNVLVATPKQALQFMKNKFIPELLQPYHFLGLMKHKIQRQDVNVCFLDQQKLASLAGRYDGYLTYNNQLALVLDYRFKDVLSYYTIKNHTANQQRLNKKYFILALNNDKLSEQEVGDYYRDYTVCATVEKLKEDKWLRTIFHHQRP